jgi:sec-independent protein translocase protein TatB
MEILGIGPSELVFIIIIALIVLGPRDMQKAGRTIGKWLRKVVTSDSWKLFQQTSREIQTLPNRLMREAALDELREAQQELRKPISLNPASPSASNAEGSVQPAQPDSREPGEPRILPPESPTEKPPSDGVPHA